MSYLTPNEVKQSVCDIIAYFKLRGQANFIRDALELFFETYHYRLPLFPDNQYFEQPENFYESDEDFFSTSSVSSIEIPICRLYGDTWLFTNDRSEGRPIPIRIANILMYILSGQKLLPIDVIKYGDKYIANDGNHRIYSAYIMGLKTIPCVIGKEILP